MLLIHGDCLERLKELEDSSVDSVVTDPPYGLSFMGKHWDYDVPSVEVWTEVLRVLKPGGHLLSFGGTRTYHRMVVAIEDAGFEIRDQLQWLYGSGFPKSHNIGKAMDKAAGAKREVVGKKSTYRKPQSPNGWDCTKREEFETAPSTDLAKKWDGWGTALKPANEPIVLARKPFKGTVAKNVEEHGTGALNIDGCRVGATNGRWPANVILDEQAGAMVGEPARFFYCAKASKSERNAGLEGMPEKYNDFQRASSGLSQGKNPITGERSGKRCSPKANHHPTVKPLKLMRYLVRLITPPGGTVLDPYAGSGTTGLAAKCEACEFIGIEREQEYIEIAERRIEHGA